MKTSRHGLVRLARLFGVELAYYAIDGRRQRADPEALHLVLRALGAELGTEHGAGGSTRTALRARHAELDARGVQPVQVAWNGSLHDVPVRLAGGGSVAAVVHLLLESGDVETVRAEAVPVPQRSRDGWIPTHRIPLGRRLPAGYHDLRVEVAGTTLESFIIAPPRRAFVPRHASQWGIFFPLYAVSSDRSWGTGDYSDLARLARWAGEHGAEFVATLPLLATFLDAPFDPSPYSPASRLFWNELFIDVTRVPGWTDSEEAAAERDACRAGRFVDYRRTAALKRRELERAWQAAAGSAAGSAAVRAGLAAFAEACPHICDYARFRAVCDRRREGWPLWPERERAGELREGDYATADYEYHLFAQWQADRQLGGLDAGRNDGAAALYLDLPLGVNADSYDVWRFRNLFAAGVSAGAPPDQLFTGGQDWGFRPLHPGALRAARYRYFIDVLRHHFRHSRMLRLDHVMALHRLFWIPYGLAATQGVYVRYPAQELFAVLVLESARHQAVVIGEDLGTVPPAVRKAMNRHQVQRMHVVQFEASPDRWPPLPPPPRNVVASLNTHDTPTFAGYWKGRDIDDQLALGLVDEAGHAAALRQRAELRAKLSRSLGAEDELEPGTACQRLLERLAGSDARFVLVTLEDMWLEEEPQNVPGTSAERPNWTRRASRSIDEITADAALRRTLAAIDARRSPVRPTATDTHD